MLAHLRTEAYPVYATHRYPPSSVAGAPSYEGNLRLIEESKRRLAEAAQAEDALERG
jgi:hypothetical protein